MLFKLMELTWGQCMGKRQRYMEWGLFWWDMVVSQEKECKLCMERAEEEGVWEEKTQELAGKPPWGVGKWKSSLGRSVSRVPLD